MMSRFSPLRSMDRPCRIAVWLLSLAVPVSSGMAGDVGWPGWRGPTRDGKDPGSPWPSKVSGGALQPVWRIKLGPSYSGPVAVGDLVFVTETRDKSHEVVRAISLSTGAEIWRCEWPGAMSVPFFAAANGSWIRSTPATDGESLFVAGMQDLLVCLEVKTGKERWRCNFIERFKTDPPAFGFVCSPLLDESHVYVQAGGSTVKLKKADGAVVWRILEDHGGMEGSAFSSPCFADIAGKKQLLVQTRTKLTGVDPDSGKVFWSQEIPAMRGMNILTPVVLGQRIFTSAYGGATLAFDIAHDGEAWQVKQAWKDNAQGYMSTPVIHDGHAYLHLRNQRLCCFDLSTGTKSWTTSERFGKYMSLALQGDRILALDERGILLLLRANARSFELLDSHEISQQPTWAHVAMVAGHVIVRELEACAVYRWIEPGEAVKAQPEPQRL